MIAPDSGKISITDIAYRDGYCDAEHDTFKRILNSLWEQHQKLNKSYPEFAEGIGLSIDQIEKLKND